MPTVVSEIVSNVIVELSQVPGVGVQLYSAGRIQQYVQDTFLLTIDKAWWPEYMCYLDTAANGTDGRLTSDLVGPLSSIMEYKDIAAVWPTNSSRRLRQLPPMTNPGLFTGGAARYMAADYKFPKRPFIVYPTQSTDTLKVWARQSNIVPLSGDDVVYLDRLLLTYGAAWMYCTDDGTVPAQVEKFQGLYQLRLDQVTDNLSQQPLQLDPRTPTDNNEWWEA